MAQRISYDITRDRNRSSAAVFACFSTRLDIFVKGYVQVSDFRYSVPALVLKIGGYPIHHGGLGIIRSLATLGVPVYTVIENRFAPAAVSRYLTGKFIWDTRGVQRDSLLKGLEDIGKRLNRLTVLIPTDDFAATLVAEEAATLRQWFLFPKLQANIPRTLANKQLLHELCKEIGIPQPHAMVPDSINDVHQLLGRVTFPVVVKAISSWPRRARDRQRSDCSLAGGSSLQFTAKKSTRLRIFLYKNTSPEVWIGSFTVIVTPVRIAWLPLPAES